MIAMVKFIVVIRVLKGNFVSLVLRSKNENTELVGFESDEL